MDLIDALHRFKTCKRFNADGMEQQREKRSIGGKEDDEARMAQGKRDGSDDARISCQNFFGSAGWCENAK